MKKMILIAVFMVVLSNNLFAVDLDSAPQSKKVTIRSEIVRGKSAVFRCAGKSYDSLINCIGNVFTTEKTKNTDTDAFILGAAFVAWSYSDNYGYKDLAKAYYTEFNKIQTELNIDDKTLCDLCSLKSEYMIPKLLTYKE